MNASDKMKWLQRPEIRQFIADNKGADTAALALQTPPDKTWPWQTIMGQIKAAQKAVVKMPSWAQNENIIYPASDVIEQASSEATALYKAGLCKGKIFADLTAGSGIDAITFSKIFKIGTAVDADEETAQTLEHNIAALGIKNLNVIHGRAEEALINLPSSDLIFIDPQRRKDGRKGMFHFSDCSPDVIALMPQLLDKSKTIMIKASPVLDIEQAAGMLKYVHDVHVVEWRGECREILYLLGKEKITTPHITAVTINDKGKPIHTLTFSADEEQNTDAQLSQPQKFLFEPSPAFQKSGCFKLIAARYNIAKLHPHTHLYTSNEPCPDFPGRRFEIQKTCAVDSKELGLKKANVSVRNFPGAAEALRKKLGLQDGGDEYVFGCTLMDDKKRLIHARKI